MGRWVSRFRSGLSAVYALMGLGVMIDLLGYFLVANDLASIAGVPLTGLLLQVVGIALVILTATVKIRQLEDRLKPRLAFTNVGAIHTHVSGKAGWAIAVTVENASGEQLRHCVIRVQALVRPDEGAARPFYPGLLRLQDPDDGAPAEYWHPRPGAKSVVFVALIYDNDPTAELRFNWGT